MDTRNTFAEYINERIKKTVFFIKCTVAVAAVVMTALAVTLIVDLFGGKVIVGFAGSVSDAFTLTERFEGMLNK